MPSVELSMSRMFCTVRLRSILNRVQRNYVTRRKSNTYYEVLGISQDASKQDIRLAFINLSKEAHPDTSSKSGKTSHDEFVKINEAYNILSKDHSRQQYDLDLKYRDNPYKSTFRRPDETVYYYRDSTWHNLRGRKFHAKSNEEYYRNIKHGPTHQNLIVVMCMFIFFIGGAIQVAAVLFGSARQYERIMRDSAKYSREYADIRSRAESNNRDRMVDVIKDTLVADNIIRDVFEGKR